MFKVIFIHAFEYKTLSELSITLDTSFFNILIIPFIVSLSLIYVILNILYAHHLLSYSVSITSDGKIIESQANVSQRIIDAKDISSVDIQILDVNPAYNSYISKIPRWIRESFLSGISRRNNGPWGLMTTKGLQFENKIYENFPRYAVSLKILNDLKVFRPDISVKNISEEEIVELQTIHTFAAIVLFIFLTIIFISLGIILITQEGSSYFNLPIIIGIICFCGATYFWNKRYGHR